MVNRAYGFTVPANCTSLPELRHFSKITLEDDMLASVSETMGHDAHEEIHVNRSSAVTVEGLEHKLAYVVAVHNTLLSAPFYREDGTFVRPALGGCRILPYNQLGDQSTTLSQEDVSNGVTAVRDVKELARGMSFKWGSLDILLVQRALTGDFVTEAEFLAARMGGGKSGNYVEGLSYLVQKDSTILDRLCPIRKGRTSSQLTDFEKNMYTINADVVLELGGRYIFAPDMNTDTAVMEFVRSLLIIRGAQVPVACLSENVGGSGDPSIVTAEGVYYSMLGAAEHVWKKDKLRNRTIGIQGVGKVGYRILERIFEDGHQTKMLFLADSSDEALQKAKELLSRYGKAEGTHYNLFKITNASEMQNFYSSPMDIFSPNAVGQVLTEDSITKLRDGGCRVIVGGANNQRHPQQRKEVDEMIVRYGIAYCPDYLVNLGGILNTIYERDDVKASLGGVFLKDRPIHVVRSLKSLVHQVLQRARETLTPSQHVIDQMVIEDIARHATFQRYNSGDVTARRYLTL